jgi:hypothetical protein
MVFDHYVVECKNNERFVIELIRKKSGSIIHAKGKPYVLKILERCNNRLGLIDEDPISDQLPGLRGVKLEPVGYDVKVGKYKGNIIVVFVS